MDVIKELGPALRVGVLVTLQGRYWASLLFALLSPAILLACAVLAGAALVLTQMLWSGLLGGVQAYAPLVLTFFASVLLGPLLMRAWCPLAARAAAGLMPYDLPEVALPSFGTFFGRCLAVMLVLLLVSISALFLGRPLKWLLWLPALAALSGFHVRCALCLHASPKETMAVASSTFWRRSLLWVVLCAWPGLLLGTARLVMRAGGADGGAGPLGVEILLGLALVALSLPTWAALALPALAAQRAIGRPVPAGTPS